MKTIFINEVLGNWILNIIGNDIYDYLIKMGYECRKGAFEEYQGEEICLHMWWRHAQPYKEAKTNAIFVTHIDDSVKEHDLLSIKDDFDIFFCMSPEDAVFLKELGFDSRKVFGINLPHRNTYIRPVTIGIFSNCYASMGVKNEQWLINYCSKFKNSNLAVFVFIGHGWAGVVDKLSSLGCSVEWCCIDRKLPGEYMYQQLKLSNLDYYLYMGMDGGAMGTYDAYAMGVQLCISDDGYHKGIPDIEYNFMDEESFNNCLCAILDKQYRKLEFFKNNSVDMYVRKMAYVLENGCIQDTDDNIVSLDYSVSQKRRSNYFPLSFKRIRQPFISALTKFLNRIKLSNKR